MLIKLKLLGFFSVILGTSQTTIEVMKNTTLAMLLKHKLRNLIPSDMKIIVVLNGERIENKNLEEFILTKGDTVTIAPLLLGGYL